MTQIDLGRLRELRAKGTQGEWYVHQPRVNAFVKSADGQFVMEPDYGAQRANADLIAAAVNAVEPLISEIVRLRALVAELTDPDPCEYDHHGNCQAHSLHSRPCPHERAKAALEEKGG